VAEPAELNESIARLRGDQADDGLIEESLDPDPYRQFAGWLEDAFHAGVGLPTAMVLATVSAEGIPSARNVLLKGFDEDGFVFYTNYASSTGSRCTGRCASRAASRRWRPSDPTPTGRPGRAAAA
jgi:pyridoxamine 5'-phosphate oxidase